VIVLYRHANTVPSQRRQYIPTIPNADTQSTSTVQVSGAFSRWADRAFITSFLSVWGHGGNSEIYTTHKNYREHWLYDKQNCSGSTWAPSAYPDHLSARGNFFAPTPPSGAPPLDSARECDHMPPKLPLIFIILKPPLESTTGRGQGRQVIVPAVRRGASVDQMAGQPHTVSSD